MLPNKEAGPPSPELRSRSPKQIANEPAYRSTLTLDSDSTAVNHPKVVASMTLGTCTSEMVWIRLRGGMEIQAGTLAVCSWGISGSREQRPAVDNLLSVCRKSSPGCWR